MIDRLNAIVNEYYQKMDIYKKMLHDVEDIMTTLIDVNQIKISNMTLRIKTEEALKNKILYKDKYNHLEEITDVLGCRIITLFEKDVDRILDLISDTFEIVEIVDKRKKNRTNRIEFGYSSLHLVLKFTDSRCELVEYQKYQYILFEVQIRTVLQHAWAEVEHGLGYKSFYEPPMDVKRKLNRLAGTLEILDEEFEDIRYEIALYNESIDRVEKVLKTDINKESLIAYVNNSELLNNMVQELAMNHHYMIIKDTDIISRQRLVTKLNFYGYQYIHELDADITKYQTSIKFIGEEMSTRIYYDNVNLNLYSTILWFSFIPVLKNVIAGRDASSEDILDDVIMEAFTQSNGSIFNVFTQRQESENSEE